MDSIKYDFLHYFEDQVIKYYIKHGKTWTMWIIAENIIEYFDEYIDGFNDLSQEEREFVMNKLDYNIRYYDDIDDAYPKLENECEY